MTKKEIIESGVLEQYVLGLLENDEEAQVLSWLEKYPDLRDHLIGIETLMEQIALDESIEPPPEARQNVLDRVEAEMNSRKPEKGSNSFLQSLGWIAAGICLLAAGMLWSSNKNVISELETLKSDKAILEKSCAEERKASDENRRLLDLYESEVFTTVALEGTENYSNSRAVVFWNNQDRVAYLNCVRFPKPPDGHIYQIWVDVDGEMLSTGTFSGEGGLIELRHYDRITSLNITIEKGQGSDHPDVSNLIMNTQV